MTPGHPGPKGRLGAPPFGGSAIRRHGNGNEGPREQACPIPPGGIVASYQIVRTPAEILRLDVDGGKYTVVQRADGSLYSIQHGGAWAEYMSGIGHDIAIAMVQEIKELRGQIAALKNKKEEYPI